SLLSIPFFSFFQTFYFWFFLSSGFNLGSLSFWFFSLLRSSPLPLGYGVRKRTPRHFNVARWRISAASPSPIPQMPKNVAITPNANRHTRIPSARSRLGSTNPHTP